MIVTDEQRQQFREQGYFLLPNAFAAAEIDALTERLDRFAEAHEAQLLARGAEGISRPSEISFTSHLAEHDPQIMAFATQEAFISLATTLISPDVSLYWDQSVYKKPETHRDFPWHQDNGYTQIEPQEYLTCWVALVDANVQNGCIWVLPGSHTDGVVEHRDTPIGKQCYFGDDPGVAVELPKGGMAVFSSLLFHRSGPNLSNTIRKSYILQYSAADARNARTGELLNRPVIARNGQPV